MDGSVPRVRVLSALTAAEKPLPRLTRSSAMISTFARTSRSPLDLAMPALRIVYLLLADTVLAAELVNASARVDDLLLTGIERVA